MNPKPLKNHTLERRKRLLGKGPLMTVVAGFRCMNGIVLGADSLEEDGLTKKYVQKLWSYQVSNEWGIAIASAGEGDLADSFTDGIRDILGNSDFDKAKLFGKLRSAIREIRLTYLTCPLLSFT